MKIVIQADVDFTPKGRSTVQSPVQLQTFRHNETGMVMMRAVTLPGFIVFGDSEDELEAKVVPAFESFLEAAQLHDGRHWKVSATPPLTLTKSVPIEDHDIGGRKTQILERALECYLSNLRAIECSLDVDKHKDINLSIMVRQVRELRDDIVKCHAVHIIPEGA